MPIECVSSGEREREESALWFEEKLARAIDGEVETPGFSG